MLGATQIMFKQWISVISVYYGEVSATKPDLLANKDISDWIPDCQRLEKINNCHIEVPRADIDLNIRSLALLMTIININWGKIHKKVPKYIFLKMELPPQI